MATILSRQGGNMDLTGLIDLNSQGQPEIQMSFPVDILAKGTLRYDPPLNGVIISSGGMITIRIPEFEIAATGRNPQEAEYELQEMTTEWLRRSRYNPPDLDAYEKSVATKMKGRARRPGF